MTNTFSIITVSKNNFNGIKETLESIKNLKSNNFEWIPVINGNCNKTLNLLKENHSFKVHPIINKDKNIWDAMNLGIEKSVNEYLIFMNAGDRFYNKNILLKISDFIIENKHPDLIYGNTISITSF